jgi:hypothetical protein
VRYISENLKIRSLIENPIALFAPRNPNGNPEILMKKENNALLENAVTFLIKRIREEDPDRIILFAMDFPRDDLYNGVLAKSPLLSWNRLVRDVSRTYHCNFLDLSVSFSKHYSINKARFDSPIDYHWNELGHKVTAEALAREVNDIVATRGWPAGFSSRHKGDHTR